MTTKQLTDSPSVLAIGGGKGGVGKSVIAANLAIALARRGTSVTLVDMDLGGANLHTLLGIPRPATTLDDFVQRRVPLLQDAVTPTGIDGLGLLAGAGPGSANTPFARKERLLRNLRTLPTSRVILDLGAGTTFNVLDFFVDADIGIVVTVPEHTSVENANNFLRAAFFRRLARSPATRPHRETVRGLFKQSRDGRTTSPRELLAQAASREPECARLCDEALEGFAPTIVFNQVRSPDERELARMMAGAFQDYFGLPARAAGALPADQLVTRSVRERRPVVEAYPKGPFSSAIDALAAGLLTPGSSNG